MLKSKAESLEPRMLLAGNVTAVMEDGHLIVRGDERNNGIVIEADGEGVLFIRGDDSTRINGDFAPVILENLTGRVRIGLGAGNDRVEINGVALPANVRVRTGAGNDEILVKSTRVIGGLSVDSADGNDTVNLLEARVGGETRVVTGEGGDLFTADASTFRGDFSLATGDGDDIIFLGSSNFPGNRRIKRGEGEDRFVRQAITFNTNFRNGAQGWSAGFSDYFTGREDEHQLDSGIEPLPDELGEGRGFMISGMNLTDDLFMYLTKRLQGNGLEPSQTYQVRFDMTFGSNGYNGCGGIGGTPGTSVFLKAGASPKRPANFTDDKDHERINIDKGNQAMDGRDASTAGHIGVGRPDECEIDGPFKSKRARHIHRFNVKTDRRGRIHAIVGTDSGFEGDTTIHWQRVRVQFVPIS